MVKPVLERVTNTLSDTAKALQVVASGLKRAGLPGDAVLLEQLAGQLVRAAYDCLNTTQPISLSRDEHLERLNQLISASSDLAADLLMNGRRGASDVAEASRLLSGAASLLDD